jgi:hypothetical protein
VDEGSLDHEDDNVFSLEGDVTELFATGKTVRAELDSGLAEAKVVQVTYDSDSDTTFVSLDRYMLDPTLSRVTVSMYTGDVRIGLDSGRQILAHMNQALVDNDLAAAITTPRLHSRCRRGELLLQHDHRRA